MSIKPIVEHLAHRWRLAGLEKLIAQATAKERQRQQLELQEVKVEQPFGLPRAMALVLPVAWTTVAVAWMEVADALNVVAAAWTTVADALNAVAAVLHVA